MGDWKLAAQIDAPRVRQRGGIDAADQETIKTAPLGEMALYNLSRDIGETMDLKTSEPERFARMKEILQAQYRAVQEDTPVWPEWEFARYEAQRIEWPDYRGNRPVRHRTPLIPPAYIDNPTIESVE